MIQSEQQGIASTPPQRPSPSILLQPTFLGKAAAWNLNWNTLGKG
jgi:hypothetical protein